MKPVTRSFYETAIQRTIEQMAANLDGALDLECLARGAGLSAFHFHRVFRGMVGETPLELIRRLRMERAAWRLARSTGSITDIAFDAGYETHEAFTRAFRACYSTSPTGFRHRRHPRIEIAAACGVHYDARGIVPPFIPRNSGGDTMEVEIKEMPELRVGAVRHVGPYNQIPQAFERLGSIAGPAGLAGRPDAALVAIYYDDPDTTPQPELRSDAGLTVPERTPLPSGLTEQRLAPGRYARTVHGGPYEQLGDAWARFMGEWLPSSGFRIGPGPSYEIYRNTPATAPKEQLLTDLYLPLE
ncbi:MAG TPA: AraC family transcriptional regulator [Vicinamibacterales bacterium]|nr:AraC family transcriptional regulator [Vicinamibacterales bacterium]